MNFLPNPIHYREMQSFSFTYNQSTERRQEKPTLNWFLYSTSTTLWSRFNYLHFNWWWKWVEKSNLSKAMKLIRGRAGTRKLSPKTLASLCTSEHCMFSEWCRRVGKGGYSVLRDCFRLWPNHWAGWTVMPTLMTSGQGRERPSGARMNGVGRKRCLHRYVEFSESKDND